jgi:hypothetical protein
MREAGRGERAREVLGARDASTAACSGDRAGAGGHGLRRSRPSSERRQCARRPTIDRMRPARGGLRAMVAVVVACVAGGIMLSPVGAGVGTYRVIDETTGAPLEGAVVVIVWHRAAFHGVTPYHVVERVSAADGTFAATVFPGLTLLEARRDVLVYKPGYRPRIERTRDREAPLFGQTEIALTKVTSLDEVRSQRPGDLGVRVCDGGRDPACVSPARVPELMRRLAIHEKVYHPRPTGTSPWGQKGR